MDSTVSRDTHYVLMLPPDSSMTQDKCSPGTRITLTKAQAQRADPIHQVQLHEREDQKKELHQQVLRPDKIVKGERVVECAKSCRACCNIDEPTNAVGASTCANNKESEAANCPVTFKTWTASQCSSSGTSQDCRPENVSDGKLSNSLPLVLGLVPSACPKQESPPKGRFQCKVCFKLFTQKVNLSTHERIHLGERPYQCKTCMKAFTQQSNLVTHERIHTGERPYQCQVCSKRFTQRQNLTAHERIHLGERPFQCRVCQKAFTQRQNLVAHERIHLGERPYQCQVCSKSFTQQQNLTAHERIHSSDRLFLCSVCHKTFTQELNLTKHMRTHLPEKLYLCQYCNKTFADQSSHSTHERSHLVENTLVEGRERKKKVFVYALDCQQSDSEAQEALNALSPLFPTERPQ